MTDSITVRILEDDAVPMSCVTLKIYVHFLRRFGNQQTIAVIPAGKEFF